MTSPLRVMWLLNHSAARKFEIPMLKSIGVDEVYLPKVVPTDHSFRSASIDFSEDQFLTIPVTELEILNREDWYGTPSQEAWAVANRHFQVVFFIAHREEIFRSVCSNFHGAIVWRTFGLDRSLTYSTLLSHMRDGDAWRFVRKAGQRFWFGEAYQHLHEIEEDALQDQAVFLPVGLASSPIANDWSGSDRRIYFVCPEIASNSYYQQIYSEFRATFDGFDFVIGGVQPLPVADKRVLGFVPLADHERNMREFRVMFYHSDEPNHIHYHPFEAIRAGMPLVFMAGGILDRFGGARMPGRCASRQEARDKVRRILDDDWTLINAIRTSQVALLDPMAAENCIESWRTGFTRILRSLEHWKNIPKRISPTRIAVILPLGYRGGTLQGAKSFAKAIEAGAQRAGESIEIVFAHLNDASVYSSEDFLDLPDSIKRRPYAWKRLDADQAYRAMAFAGLPREMSSEFYLVPDDGINQFLDCKLWVFVSDRLSEPILPIRPYALMVYDYLQRYVGSVPLDMSYRFFSAARSAERVFVTTEFTRRDALQFAGLPAKKIVKLPMLAPIPHPVAASAGTSRRPYFIWPTNLGEHKNHKTAFEALRTYYDHYDGSLDCRITGVGTKSLLSGEQHYLKAIQRMVKSSKQLERHVKFHGELDDHAYRQLLSGAAFLWHAALIDNGTFAVIEAAELGVPSLSSDYPPMREIDAEFQLRLVWVDAKKPSEIARQLKHMEQNSSVLAEQLADWHQLAVTEERAASEYWTAIRECL